MKKKVNQTLVLFSTPTCPENCSFGNGCIIPVLLVLLTDVLPEEALLVRNGKG